MRIKMVFKLKYFKIQLTIFTLKYLLFKLLFVVLTLKYLLFESILLFVNNVFG